MIQERSQADIDYERKRTARGNVAYGYFEHPDAPGTWIDPRWRDVVDMYPGMKHQIEREIDRRIRIVAMGA